MSLEVIGNTLSSSVNAMGYVMSTATDITSYGSLVETTTAMSTHLDDVIVTTQISSSQITYETESIKATSATEATPTTEDMQHLTSSITPSSTSLATSVSSLLGTANSETTIRPSATSVRMTSDSLLPSSETSVSSTDIATTATSHLTEDNIYSTSQSTVTQATSSLSSTTLEATTPDTATMYSNSFSETISTQTAPTDENTNLPPSTSLSSSVLSSSTSSYTTTTDQVSSSFPTSSNSTADTLESEILRLRAKVDEANETVRSLTIAIAVVASVLALVIVIFLIYKIVTYVRKKREPAVQVVMESLDGNLGNREQKSYFRPQTMYDLTEKDGKRYSTPYSNQAPRGDDNELTTFRIKNQSPLPGRAGYRNHTNDFTSCSSTDDKEDIIFGNSGCDNIGASADGTKDGSSSMFVDVNLK